MRRHKWRGNSPPCHLLQNKYRVSKKIPIVSFNSIFELTSCSERLDWSKPGVYQLPVELLAVWASIGWIQTPAGVASGEVQRRVPPRPGIRALVGQEEVKLGAGGHWVLTERVLTGQVVAHNARKADLRVNCVIISRSLLQF